MSVQYVSLFDAQSVGAVGAATAPGAGAAIATIAAGSLPQKARYRVQVVVGFDAGTPAAADRNNFELRKASTVVTALAAAITPLGLQQAREVIVDLDGSQALSVNATGAATAGVSYVVGIVATRIP